VAIALWFFSGFAFLFAFFEKVETGVFLNFNNYLKSYFAEEIRSTPNEGTV